MSAIDKLMKHHVTDPHDRTLVIVGQAIVESNQQLAKSIQGLIKPNEEPTPAQYQTDGITEFIPTTEGYSSDLEAKINLAAGHLRYAYAAMNPEDMKLSIKRAMEILDEPLIKS